MILFLHHNVISKMTRNFSFYKENIDMYFAFSTLSLNSALGTVKRVCDQG